MRDLISEAFNVAVNNLNYPIIDNVSAVMDFKASTCLSPFLSGRKVFHLDFAAHLSTTREQFKVIVITNISCREPFTVMGIRSNCGASGNDGVLYHQCVLLSETAEVDTYNCCIFACTCLVSCDGIFLRQQFLPWRGDDPKEYRTCDVEIIP